MIDMGRRRAGKSVAMREEIERAIRKDGKRARVLFVSVDEMTAVDFGPNGKPVIDVADRKLIP